MPDGRRHCLPGGAHFFTVNLLERRSDLVIRHIALLLMAVRAVRRANLFHIDAWVIDWPYSTFDRYVDVGLYPKGWAGKVPDLQAAERKESEAWRRKALRYALAEKRNAPFGASGRRCYRRRGDEQNIGKSAFSVNLGRGETIEWE